jgi:hypothetical protein
MGAPGLVVQRFADLARSVARPEAFWLNMTDKLSGYVIPDRAYVANLWGYRGPGSRARNNARIGDDVSCRYRVLSSTNPINLPLIKYRLNT